MKHVSVPDAVDLSRPTLENLSHILRHRELWPKGFSWNYTKSDCCAMGLGTRIWGDWTRIFGNMNDSALGDAVSLLFLGVWRKRRIDMKDVAPEMVADVIDEYLRSRT